VSEGAPKKEQRRKFQAIRGTRDLLPPETALWNHVEETAHAVFGTFGFGEIRVPIFEQLELFARSIGLDTDIVNKEMFVVSDGSAIDLAMKAIPPGKILDAQNDPQLAAESARSVASSGELGLRPEATASVCRAYIEHGMQQLPQPVKLYYMGPMFRRERPQKGRYRQFYQIGAEVLGGSDAPAIDAEVIEMVMTFFDRVGLGSVELDINSIGHNAPNCRPAYVEKLRAALAPVKDKLGADSQRRIETNPLRVLDSKLEHEQPIIATLPRIADHLCAECATHYAAVKRQLELRGVFFKENWRLVRGLDYYMRTTFEMTAKGLGSQNAVCGGGRYDGLVELLGGPPTKGIGFAIGEDRLILSLQESGQGAGSQGRDVYIAWMGERAYATAVRAAKDLRNAGFSVELPPTEVKFGKALERADKLGSRYALILGDNEVSEGSWTLKTLADGTQQKFTEPELLEFLKSVKAGGARS
jgi:histidyl-tRNA synthetase